MRRAEKLGKPAPLHGLLARNGAAPIARSNDHGSLLRGDVGRSHSSSQVRGKTGRASAPARASPGESRGASVRRHRSGAAALAADPGAGLRSRPRPGARSRTRHRRSPSGGDPREDPLDPAPDGASWSGAPAKCGRDIWLSEGRAPGAVRSAPRRRHHDRGYASRGGRRSSSGRGGETGRAGRRCRDPARPWRVIGGLSPPARTARWLRACLWSL